MHHGGFPRMRTFHCKTRESICASAVGLYSLMGPPSASRGALGCRGHSGAVHDQLTDLCTSAS